MRRIGWILSNVLVATTLIVAAACSKSSTPADDGTSSGGDGGGTRSDSGGGTNLPNPNTTGNPDAAGGADVVVASDGGIQGPTFDVTKVASIQGTFVTDKSAVNGVSTNATVTWSFKIDSIGDLSTGSGSAIWNVQATNVVGGNASDFPPDTDVPLDVTSVSGVTEFNALSPSYVLVHINDGKITDFYFYRRVVDDNEPQPPPDKPHNVTYTVTSK